MTTMQAEAAVERRYPQGVFSMFFLQLFSMIGFSMVFALLVLYVTYRLHFDVHHAFALSATFNALVFAFAVFGGYLGERFLGYRYAVWLSIILATIGMLILAIPRVDAVYWGLAIFIVATGIMTPCLFVLLGRLYHAKDPRRDSGFTIAYIGMNVGSFSASIASGYLTRYGSYSGAFLIGAFFTFVLLIVFLLYRKDFKHSGEVMAFVKTRPDAIKRSRMMGVCLVAISLPITAFLVRFASISNLILLVVGVMAVGLVIYLAMQESKQYRSKLFVYLMLTVISVAFWALYSLTPSAIIMFVHNNVDRHLFGYAIPTASYSALNPLFIIIFGPLISFLWMYLNYHNRGISTPAKFAIGVFLMGGGFLILAVGIGATGSHGLLSSWWIVLSYLLQTLGELCVGPIGFAMVGELVPARLEGLMMGIWQLAAGVAGALTEFMANYTTSPKGIAPAVTNPIYAHAFLLFGSITIGVAVINVLLVPYLKKLSSLKDAVVR
jgi:proton-dependent oligopeptide transporter, POT family